MTLFSYFEPDEGVEEEIYDEYEKNAEIQILEMISQHQVVTDRELKVRLERIFFPWVVGRTLNRLVEDGKVKLVGAPGRNSRMGTPDNFFMNPALRYEDLLSLILRKRRISSYINSLLTRMSPAGYYAEDIFEDAFISLRFEIVDREASKYKGKSVTGVPGKELPDLDFIIEKDKIVYGVDIKNWIKYEFDSITEVMEKVDLAKQLGIIPFICARYVDKDTFYKIVNMPGIVYQYETLILPPAFKSLADEARTLLGYPILAVDVLPHFKIDFISKLHTIMVERLRKKNV